MAESICVIEPSREDEILGGRAPMATLGTLFPGPLISQFTNSMYGFINTIWLGQAASELSTTAISAALTIDSLAIGFGFFLNTCASSKLSSLFGEGKPHLASQVISDLLRLSLIIGMLLPAILLPVSKPFMKWIGASQQVADLGFDYLIPVLGCSFVTCIYLLMCGMLQAEGRSYLYGAVQLLSMILNGAVFNPLFLLGCKMGIIGSSASLILSQGIPALGLLIALYCGKFTTKPTMKELISRPSPETIGSLKVGLSSLISNLSTSIPGILFQYFIGLMSASESQYNTVMSIYNAYQRTVAIIIAIYNALGMAFLPAGSYAYSSGKYRRVLVLIFHTTWITIIFSLVTSTIIYAFPKTIGSIFSKNEEFLNMFKRCAIPYFSSLPVEATSYISTTLFQACKWSTVASWTSFISQFLVFPACTLVFYFSYKHDVEMLFWTGFANDFVATAIVLPFVIYLIKKDLLKPDEDLNDIENAKEDQSESNDQDKKSEEEEKNSDHNEEIEEPIVEEIVNI